MVPASGNINDFLFGQCFEELDLLRRQLIPRVTVT
jgi:hypothetical protein